MQPSRPRSFSNPLFLPSEIKKAPMLFLRKANTCPGTPVSLTASTELMPEIFLTTTVPSNSLQNSATILASSVSTVATLPFDTLLYHKLSVLYPLSERLVDLIQEPSDLQNIRELLSFSNETITKTSDLFSSIYERIQRKNTDKKIHTLFLFCLSWLNQNQVTQENKALFTQISKVGKTHFCPIIQALSSCILPLLERAQETLAPQIQTKFLNFENIVSQLTEDNLVELAAQLALDLHQHHVNLYCQIEPDHVAKKWEGGYGTSMENYNNFLLALSSSLKRCQEKFEEKELISNFLLEVAAKLLEKKDFPTAKSIYQSLSSPPDNLKKLFQKDDSRKLRDRMIECEISLRAYIPLLVIREPIFFSEVEEIEKKIVILKMFHQSVKDFLSQQEVWKSSL